MSEFDQSEPIGAGDPGQPEARSGGPQPPSTNPYQDFWDDCWDQPRIVEVPSAADLSWPAPPTAEPAAAGYPPAADNDPVGGSYHRPAGYHGSAGYHPTASFTPYGPPARRSRRPWILGAAAAVLVLLFGGGGLAAYQVLNGGGVQPEQVVPATTTAFFKFDLNPSASQKINAARLLHRLPKLGALTGSGDWRRQMFQALAEDGSVPAGVSYDRDIKPWLGERAAIAMLPGPATGAAEPLLVLQCGDDGKARRALSRFGGVSGISFYRGYALIAPSQPLADQAAAEAKAANLGATPTYRADFAQLGASGIVAGWADLSTAGGTGVMPAGLAAGRFAFTVRVAPNALDLVGRFEGAANGGRSVAGPDLGTLPANTAIAVGAGVDPAAVNRSWREYQDLLDQTSPLLGVPGLPGAALTDQGPLQSLQRQFGLRLPTDLTTVLGSGLTLSVGADERPDGSVPFAVQTRTDGPAAVTVLDRIRRSTRANGMDFPLSYQASGEGLSMTNDRGYLAGLRAGGSAKLDSLKSFHSALPEAAGASLTGFVNIDAIVADMRAHSDNTDEVQAWSAFSAAGLTVHSQDGSANLHIRLLAH